TLMNKTQTMMIAANLPDFLWDEIYLTASYLHSLTTTKSLNGKTPAELWIGTKPNLSHLREIRCQAFVLIKMNNPIIHHAKILTF
ncbi:hypothetical protein K435DRAFT_695704, partial [Dendrothele bispora CBS 962.96]